MKNNLDFNLDDFEIALTSEEITKPLVDEQEDDNTEEVDSSDDTNDKTYSDDSDEEAIAAFEVLKRSGLYDEDLFDGTWESIETQTNSLQDKVINSVLGSLPENVQSLVELAILEGQELTVDKLQKYVDTLKSDDIDTSDLSEDDARERLQKIYEHRGMSTKAINRMLDALEDNDELLDELKTELEKEKESKKDLLKQQAEDKKKEISEENAKIKEFNNNIIKSLKETGWKEEKQRQVVTELQSLGNKMETIKMNPKALVDLADVLSYFGKDGFDRTKFLKSNGSTVNSNIKENALRDAFTNKATNMKIASKQKNESENLDDFEVVSPLTK